jgi:5,10-methylene-tetrahydrofolate dehydrogenase/methenyl tetrahydrofolate cyclohydrolase
MKLYSASIEPDYYKVRYLVCQRPKYAAQPSECTNFVPMASAAIPAITADMVKPGAVVIDVRINEVGQTADKE